MSRLYKYILSFFKKDLKSILKVLIKIETDLLEFIETEEASAKALEAAAIAKNENVAKAIAIQKNLTKLTS